MVESIQHIASQIEPRAGASAARHVEPGDRKPVQSKPPISGVPWDFPDVVKDINTLVSQVSSTKMTFEVDSETGRPIVKVLNRETGDVIRQVPPEDLLNLVARMKQLTGLIFNEEI